MKQLTCEMCGSADLMKQDGVFVCQSCGMKYSVEEAKKMMIEGTVDIQGTVKIDNTEQINNYMVLANNAYKTNNNKEAELYCNKIIEIDPEHPEAWLLKGAVAGWQSTGANIRMDEFIKCASNAFNFATSPDELNDLAERAYRECYSLIIGVNNLRLRNLVSYPNSDDFLKYMNSRKDYLTWGLQIQLAYGQKFNSFYKDKPEEERIKPNSLQDKTETGYAIDACNKEAADKGIELWEKAYNEYKTSNNGYPTKYDFDEMKKKGNIAITLTECDIPSDASKIDSNKKAYVINLCEKLISMYKAFIDLKSYTIDFSSGIESHPVEYSITLDQKKTCTDSIKKYYGIIKECNPSFEVPVIEEPQASTSNSGGCYVATAVYGSYDCPQVWTLRRYRDYTLAETWHGRAFIKTYYAISPTLVKWFGHTEWFKKMWQGKLDRMVAKLQANGVESTPYEDKNW